MSKMWTDRSCVFVVTTAADFTPQSPWNIPACFADAKEQCRNIPLEDARATVRALNGMAMQRRGENPSAWDRQWAIVVACPRAKGLDRFIKVASAKVGRQGGVA